jgi:hypothetical protein
MPWIESHLELNGHPKTKRLRRLLGISNVSAVGHLHLFWWWVFDYAVDGDVTRFSATDIAAAAEWEGDDGAFLEAMISAGFLEHQDGKLMVHDWREYAGKWLERRERNAARMREARATHVQRTNGDVQRTDDARATHVRARATLPDHTTPHQTVDSPDGESTRTARKPAHPMEVLFETMCRTLGFDASTITGAARNRQLTIARRLAEDGATPDEIAAETKWLMEQSWLESPIDMKLIDSQRAKWLIGAKSVRAPTPDIKSRLRRPSIADAVAAVQGTREPENVIDASYREVTHGE